MSVVSFDKRLRRIEAIRSGETDELRSLFDDELVDVFRQPGPLTADDEAFVSWFPTGAVPPGFDPVAYIAPVLR